MLIVTVSGTGVSYAQWSREDSLWLRNVLEGKDSLRLNIEAIRAIERGDLLNNSLPKTQTMMRISRPKLEIAKDFSQYINVTDTAGKLALKDLPPGVFWLHQIEYVSPRYKVNPMFFKVYPNSLRKLRDGKNEGPTINGLDFAHPLNYVFSKDYRQHVINQKRTKKLKDYEPWAEGSVYKPAGYYKEGVLPLPSVTRKKTEVKDTVRTDSVKTASLHPATIRSMTAQDSLSAVSPADSLLNKMQPTPVLLPVK